MQVLQPPQLIKSTTNSGKYQQFPATASGKKSLDFFPEGELKFSIDFAALGSPDASYQKSHRPGSPRVSAI